ncbi:FAD-linked oxidoreductase-like protein [Zychaea mexicana]|uniref:FAD-linked oxidoreductase-like protein n=1 Tax=Zychaea mexicana TaxID=64656 RepID=UPI0022FE2095|nr:FAD-linked oxidoreductase-like protein [Zychaea mexicana]KAI9488936.1 FAD-linked oxidoreductase-like protein [Zychaea mexicana]
MLHRAIPRATPSPLHCSIRWSPPQPQPLSSRFLRLHNLPSSSTPFRRSYVTPSSSRPHQHQRPHFKSISASVALASAASLMYFYNAQRDKNVVHAESTMPLSAFSAASPSNVLAELNDDDNRSFLQAKSTEELVLATFVYKLCTLSWLVDAAPHLIHLAHTLGMEKVAYWVVRSTFFKNFCGGETAEECMSVMDKLTRSGINSILDLSVEADENVTQDAASLEKLCDFNMKMMKIAIETAARGQQQFTQGSFFSSTVPLVAVKVTALTTPDLLLKLNQAIATLDKAFHEHQVEGKVSVDSLRTIADQVFPTSANDKAERDAIFTKLASEKASVDFIEYTNLFNTNSSFRDVWYTHGNLLNKDDLVTYDRMIARINEICTLAKDVKAGIMIDAEQTYFQEAIDHVAINMESKYNRRDEERAPTVYNTYQMYTKASLRKVKIDVERAHRENFAFAAKLVRGAYMVSERKRAIEMGYPSPIHDTLEDTHASYNGGVRFLLSKLHEHQEETGEPLTGATAPIVFMVASHNRESVILTIEEMERQGVLPRSGVVHFGQLYGMQDQISYALGKNGYSIYKYLPYGLIQDVLPYLIRRAQENSSVLGSVTKERELIFQEIKDRLAGKAGKPVIQSAPTVVVTQATAGGAPAAESSPATEAPAAAETA